MDCLSHPLTQTLLSTGILGMIMMVKKNVGVLHLVKMDLPFLVIVQKSKNFVVLMRCLLYSRKSVICHNKVN